ncbi:MAG TPA: hypothetical protein VMY37_21030 [Thermoguttaceae bacterium]|nr:hypothetical protein [Thermoguttaceae bacterium]
MTPIDRRHFFGGIAGGALGLVGSDAAVATEPNAARPASTVTAADGRMQILSAFDGGLLPAATIDGDTITFNLNGEVGIVNVLVRGVPARLRVRLLIAEKAATFVAGQGLITSPDGLTWTATPLAEAGGGVLEATLDVPQGEVRLATRHPYGRDSLDRLICDTAGVPNTRWRYLWKGHRGMPLFELGQDDGRKWIHFLCAGEDAWETSGQWTADAMIRTLCSDRALADALAAQAVVRIVPLASPYSTTQPAGGYTTVDGQGIYGAATWGDDDPPPEYALLRAEAEEAIRAKRLGFMMTLHSWQASLPHTGLETIQSAGENKLSPARMAWANRTLAALIAGVPKGKTALPPKIWHAGLARDYLLAKYNAVTFRVEVTTHNQGLDGFRQTGRKFLENLSTLTEWAPVCNP